MRSILQEGTSIPKAIEKAWNEAGKPQEFSVKVFDAGEKNFLGFSKRPAVISLLFDPRKTEVKKEAAPQGYRRDTRDTGSIQPSFAKRQKVDHQNNRSEPQGQRMDSGNHASYERENRSEPKKVQPRNEQPAHNRPAHNPENQPHRRGRHYDQTLWTNEAMEDIKGWLAHVTSIMGINIPFNTHAENHLLKIEFSKPLFDSSNEERMLFSSFAFILMQFLKRKHKKKFKGCRLAISSRRG